MDNVDTPLGLPRVNLVPDTHLAALLRQHGVATLYTRDRDFLRFDFLSVVDPLETAIRDQPARRRRASLARA